MYQHHFALRWPCDSRGGHYGVISSNFWGSLIFPLPFLFQKLITFYKMTLVPQNDIHQVLMDKTKLSKIPVNVEK